MIHWIWIPVALIVGASLGIGLIAMVSANEPGRRSSE